MKNSKQHVKRKCITCKKIFILPDWEQYKNRKACSKKCVPRTPSWCKKISNKRKSEGNGMWKGSRAGLQAIHIWISKRKKKPKLCENCKKAPPVDLANISQKYYRNVNDFEWLCRKCHMIKDGRLNTLIKNAKKQRKYFPKKCFICKKIYLPKERNSSCCSLSCAAKKANFVRWGTIKT